MTDAQMDVGASRAPTAASQRSVLIIEDEANIIEALKFILSREGWQVFTHSNGHDAFDAIQRYQPDAVILDVMLPGRSGYDILRDLRAEPGLADLPVLMLTARGQSKDQDMAQSLGANLFMTKPFANAQILDALKQLVGG